MCFIRKAPFVFTNINDLDVQSYDNYLAPLFQKVQISCTLIFIGVNRLHLYYSRCKLLIPLIESEVKMNVFFKVQIGAPVFLKLQGCTLQCSRCKIAPVVMFSRCKWVHLHYKGANGNEVCRSARHFLGVKCT